MAVGGTCQEIERSHMTATRTAASSGVSLTPPHEGSSLPEPARLSPHIGLLLAIGLAAAFALAGAMSCL